MASPDADASPRARSQWQRAVSAVAARDGTDAGPPSSDFSSVAAEATFVRRLNSRKSFSAAFGRRSLSGKVVKIVDDAELSRDAAPRSTAPRSSAPASPPPAARRLSGDLASRPEGDVVTLEGVVHGKTTDIRVRTVVSENLTLEPVVAFKPSQFFRTALYESLPPGANWLAVLAVETLLFGHTPEEARFAAGARLMVPTFVVAGTPMVDLYKVPVGAVAFANIGHLFMFFFWFPVVLSFASPEVSAFLAPQELATCVIIYFCRVFVISCKYSLLPESYVSDARGIMYRKIRGEDASRHIVGVAWNDPKHPNHFDLLQMEMERACLEADVDLEGTEIDVGSAPAAAILRARARGLGERRAPPSSSPPTRVCGKELLAALVEQHVGVPIPPAINAFVFFAAVAFALILPVARAAVGVAAFGDTPLRRTCAAFVFIYSQFTFMGNVGFSLGMSWTFRRANNAMTSLNAMIAYPGEPAATFLPPRPKKRKAPSSSSSSSAPPGSNAKITPSTHGASNDDADDSDETAEQRALRRAGEAGEMICVDLKDPESCLGWALVRRALRKVGSPWSRRLNLFSVIYLICSLACALCLLLLYYGAERVTHRLSTSLSLFFLAVVVSAMVSITVLEGSLLNDMVCRVRTRLRREMFAIAAQLNVGGAEAVDDPGEAKRLECAHRMIDAVDRCVHAEEDPTHGSEPVEVFSQMPATPAAVTFVASTLVSLLLVATQRAFTMIEQEGWSYGGEGGEFAQWDGPPEGGG